MVNDNYTPTPTQTHSEACSCYLSKDRKRSRLVLLLKCACKSTGGPFLKKRARYVSGTVLQVRDTRVLNRSSQRRTKYASGTDCISQHSHGRVEIRPRDTQTVDPVSVGTVRINGPFSAELVLRPAPAAVTPAASTMAGYVQAAWDLLWSIPRSVLPGSTKAQFNDFVPVVIITGCAFWPERPR